MITEAERERIRRAYFIEQKSKRHIEREVGCSRTTVDKALGSAEARPYQNLPVVLGVLGIAMLVFTPVVWWKRYWTLGAACSTPS